MQWINLEDNYFINNLGQVRNGDKIIKIFKDRNYWYATINCRKKRLHRLVALCFIPNPNNLSEVDHIDGNTDNNTVENLRWANRSTQNKNRKTYTILGYKYIRYIDKCRKYRLTIKNIFDGYFDSLDEAINTRRELIQSNNLEWRDDYDRLFQ